MVHATFGMPSSKIEELGSDCCQLAPFCELVNQKPAGGCRRMLEQITALLEDATGPLLTCCWAGAKLLAMPPATDQPVGEAIVFATRSPHEDWAHLLTVAQERGLDYAKLRALWRDLPPFSRSYADQVIETVELDKDDPRADQVRSLAGTYDPPEASHLGLYDMDVRVFHAIEGLQLLGGDGITRVDAAYVCRVGESRPVARWFCRSYGAPTDGGVAVAESPIRGFCLVPARLEDLTAYLKKFAGQLGRKGPTEVIGTCLLGKEGNGQPSPAEWVHTRELVVPMEAGNGNGELVWLAGGADVWAAQPDTPVAALTHDCVAAASDPSDTRASAALAERLDWEDTQIRRQFEQLLGQCAYFLDDPKLSPEQDAWQRVMRALHAGLYARELTDGSSPSPELPAVVGSVVEWLSKYESRKAVQIALLRQRLPESSAVVSERSLQMSDGALRLSLLARRILVDLALARFGPDKLEAHLDSHLGAAAEAILHAASAGMLSLDSETGRDACRRLRERVAAQGDAAVRNLEHLLYDVATDEREKRRRDAMVSLMVASLQALRWGAVLSDEWTERVRRWVERRYVRQRIA